MSIIGRIHSIETCGTLDGPGIRYVAFFQGCPLRCKYCHNPDTWVKSGGTEYTTNELLQDIKKYKSYITPNGGGFTAGGGEPLMQPEFLLELFKKLKKIGVHTAIDTSGYAELDTVKEVLKYTDLVLLDIKSINPETFKKITAQEIDLTLALAKYLNEKNIPVWIRNVIVPELSDNIEDIENLAKYLKTLSNIEKVQFLPFHKMGEFKWEALNIKYDLAETEAPEKQVMSHIKEIFKQQGLPVE